VLEKPNRASLDFLQVERSDASSTYCPGHIRKVWSLHHGRSRKAIVRVVPDANSPNYRIVWPDIGLSPSANLARCMDAARHWAERKVLIEDRKNTAGRRLKSLDNFLWAASPIQFFERPVSDAPRPIKRTSEPTGERPRA
jgi:hypothetical protein